MHNGGMESYAQKLKQWRSRREQMKSLRDQGKTLDEIGRKYKISRQRVAQVLKGGLDKAVPLSSN